MRASAADAALLVFTLGASHEARRRALLPITDRPLEQRFHHACIEKALAAGRAEKFRLFVSSPDPGDRASDIDWLPQSDGGFGRRIRRAFSQAFAASAGPVVLVGGDVPDLGSRHLRAAVDHLREDADRVVIGPSPDGGLYLLASARPLDEVFAQTTWCVRGTLSSLRRALSRAGIRFVLLAPLADLDRRSDLLRWMSSRHACDIEWAGILRRLRDALAAGANAASLELSIRRVLAARPLLRGPPLRV